MAFNAQTIALALRLETGQFTAGLGMAGARVKTFAGDVQGAAGKAKGALGEMAGASDKHLKTIGTAGLIAGGAIVAGFGLAAAAALNFDKQMSEVGAVASATGDELGQLRNAAIEAGAATVFSASEAAQAEAELAKAGVSVSDILSGGLTGALDLASAGSLDLSTAAELAANAMNTFKLEGADVPHIADVLAAAANKSATDVGEMGMALRQGGLVANQFGVGLEQTAGILALFAQNGLKGSDAGTSFKTMLQRLVPQSKEAQAMMDGLGLSFFDAQGRFLGLSEVSQQLHDKLGPLSDAQRNAALSTLFGSDAVRAATILMDGGAAAVDDWTKSVDESGYAADLAAQKNDNLAGDLEQLKGSIETALIQGGSKATDVLRNLAQGATDVVNGFGEMPSTLQGTAMGLVGIVGLGASAVGIYGTMAPKIREAKAALEAMGGIGPSVAANLGTIGLAAGGATIALGVLAWAYGQQAAGQAEAEARAKRYTDAIQKQTGALQDNIDAQTRKEFADSKVGQILYDTGLDVDRMTQAVRENGTELDDWAAYISDAGGNATVFASHIEAAAKSGNEFADFLIKARDAGQITNEQMMTLITGLDSMNDAFDAGTQGAAINQQMMSGLSDEQKKAAGTTAGLGGSLEDLAGKTKSAEDKINDLKAALKAFIDQALGIPGSVDAVHSAMNQIVDDAKEVREKAGGDFSGFSDEAIRLRGTLGDVVDKGADLVTTMKQQGKSTDEIRYSLGLLGGAFLDQAEKAGVPREMAQKYYELLMGLPDQVPTEISQPGMDQAINNAQTLNGQLAVTALGAVGIIAVPGADGAITLTNSLNEQLGTVEEGAEGPVSVRGADGAFYQVSVVNGQLQAVKQGANAVVTADTTQANSAIDGLINKLDALNIQGMARIQAIIATGWGQAGYGMAHGGVVDSYAAGGIRAAEYFANGSEQHIAQIAPAGAWRVWAEPETGGEAYIPLAASKRTRSVAIWQETGRRLGMQAGSATYVNLGGVAIDARGATASDARAIRDAIEAGVAAGISKGKAELERSDRRLR